MHAHGDELLGQGRRGPVPPGHRFPRLVGQALQQGLSRPQGRWTGLAWAPFSRGGWGWGRGHGRHLVGEAPPKVTGHADHVRQPARLQASQEGGDLAIACVGHDVLAGHPPRPRAVDQRERERRLGLKRRVAGHVRPLPPRRRLRGVPHPGLVEVQARAHRPVQRRVRRWRIRDVVRADHHLTVGHLAQRARVLPRYADRRLPLLGQPRVVERQDPLRGTARHQPPHPRRVQRQRVPLRSGAPTPQRCAGAAATPSSSPPPPMGAVSQCLRGRSVNKPVT
jgi:hypothetical protein